MTDIQQKKEMKKAGTVNPIVAGIAGVIAGGAAVAAAVVLHDKKNQKKIKDAFVSVKEKVTEIADAVKSQPVIEKTTHKAEEVIKILKQ